MRKLGHTAGGNKPDYLSNYQNNNAPMQYAPGRKPRSGLLTRLSSWLFYEEAPPPEQSPHTAPRTQARTNTGATPQQQVQVPMLSPEEQRALVQQALNDWKAATIYFENVSDPALVDFAAYDMEAARRKYIYLLNSIKQRRSI